MAVEQQSTSAVGTEVVLNQVPSNLSAAREARKRAEHDAQLLSNRIALLKQEEQKAWKTIEQTRKRANEITERRAEKKQEIIAKEDFYKAKWDSIRAAQAQNAEKRDKARTVRDAKAKDLIDAKVADVQMTRQQSHKYLLQKRGYEAAVCKANAEKGNLIRQKKEEARHKMEVDRHAQQDKFHAEYCSRVAHEERLRARTVELIAKLEEEELECIQKLQNTQTLQRNACEKLETVLGQKALPNLLQQREAKYKSEKGEKVEPQPAA